MAKRKKPAADVAETSGVLQPTPEQIAAAQALQPVEMPEWYASGAQLVIAGNDAQLIFNKAVLLGAVTHGAPQMSHTVGIITPVGLVRMSMATLKDISIMLASQVEKRESEIGVIETDYTKQQKKAASKKKR